ncbi:MAG: response regulator transcription factor [Williamsia sp.]|nr:response regulator transcription factor [Williamsia sp.]
MLRCIAIDDEDLALELLEDYIGKIGYLELVALFDNAIDAVSILQEQQIDLVFVDIQMPGLTGLQFIQSLEEKPLFILVTAYEQYALEGFNLNVVDYLVKPVPFDRFLKACNKAKELHQLRSRNPKEEDQPDYLFVYVDYSHTRINFSDIVWIEGLKDYIRIHLKSTSRPLVARMSMKSMEEQLPPSLFMRIQKSYIVAKGAITAIRKNSVFIGNKELPVGENYKDQVSIFLGKQLE